jgi:hypothetical protein
MNNKSGKMMMKGMMGDMMKNNPEMMKEKS